MEKSPMGNILAVDDSSTNIALLTGILQEEGYEVTTACDGKEALDCIIEKAPDLILLDLMMPKIDGYKFLEKLKQLENRKNIPVIVISAKTTTSSVKRAIELGAVDYIKKPLDIQYLIEKVETIIKKGKN